MASPSRPISVGSRTRINSAGRAATEPRRAGAMRLAVLATILAALVGGATFVATQWLLGPRPLSRPEAVRDAPHHDLTGLLEQVRGETGTAAADERTTGALTALQDGFQQTQKAVEQRRPDDLAGEQATLTRFYENEIVPGAKGD